MKLKKLRILLLLLVIGGEIQSQKPKASDSLECLTAKEFDFYAQAVVDRKLLKADTSILSNQIKIQSKIISNKDKELSNNFLMLKNKDEIIRADTIAFNKLNVKYGKQDKKIHRLKQTSLTFMITTCLLGILVLILK